MKAVVQRVSSAAVTVDGEVVGSIGRGILAFVGVGHDDSEADAVALARKMAVLRIFPDDQGRMNLDLASCDGSALIVSQFTLLADVRRGRRPAFVAAADPGVAEPLVDRVAAECRHLGIAVESGIFGARMEVSLVNDGPVTILLETSGGQVV